MKEKEFLHCLRIQIFPGHFEDERIENIVSCAKKYGFNNVMLFINAEEYNIGHMTRDEAAEWLPTMKKAAAALRAAGISVSLNPWIELGHIDRVNTLKDGQNFTTMVDWTGKRSAMTACPLCEEWEAYFLDFYTYLITELEPDTVWIEDDFRIHNHQPLSYGGCFCELHMKRYGEKLGREITREEFVRLLFEESDEEAKRAWLDVNRECMVALAERIGEHVRSLGLGTKIGLMSSSPEQHASEGRDWHGIQGALKAGGMMINRIHLPYIYEVSAKSYYRRLNSLSMVVRALIPEETVVYPEIENCVFSSYAKDAKILQFQLESALPIGIEGMTYDIYDFVGNGVLESFGYGEAIREITPYLTSVMKLGLHPSKLLGVKIPIDERASYNRKNINSFNDLKPDDYGFGAYLLSLGLGARFTTEKRFCGELVALGGGSVNNFTDEELRALFADNTVLLEGGAVISLCERGLGGLIGVDRAEIFEAERSPHSFEGVRDGIEVNGVKGYRASAFKAAGDYVKITYSNKPKVLTDLYTYRAEPFGNGIVEGDGFYIVPFIMGLGTLFEQYNDMRTTLLRSFVKRAGKRGVMTDRAGVYAYLYEREEGNVLILVNSTEEDIESVELEFISDKINGAGEIDRIGGEDGILFSA